MLGEGPRENNVRPSIDPMLRSMALCCGSRSIGLILTGTQDDGASGLWALRQFGGVGVVQDPLDAEFPEMPASALRATTADHLTRLEDLPALIARLAGTPAGPAKSVPDSIRAEVEIAHHGGRGIREMDRIARRSELACPECRGVMWEIEEGGSTRYRCHVGHAYNAEMLDAVIDADFRGALASAVRALEEKVALARKLENQATKRGHALSSADWAGRAADYQNELDVVRKAVTRVDALTTARHRASGSVEP